MSDFHTGDIVRITNQSPDWSSKWTDALRIGRLFKVLARDEYSERYISPLSGTIPNASGRVHIPSRFYEKL